MGIYRFRIYEKSHVDIAVEADSEADARKALDGWIGDDKDHDAFRDVMNCRCEDATTLLATPSVNSTWDPDWDFYVKAEDYIKKEPLYTLVLTKKNPEDSDVNIPCVFRQTYVDLTFDEVLRKLQEANKNRIIHPGAPDQAANAKAISYNNILLYYTYEWR